jgi:DNA-binding NtrC family response regulator
VLTRRGRGEPVDAAELATAGRDAMKQIIAKQMYATVAQDPYGMAQIGIEDIPPEYCLEHFGRLALSRAQQATDRNDRSMYQQAMSHFERYLVRQTVDRCHGHKAEAARILGISYSSLKVKFGTTDPAD